MSLLLASVAGALMLLLAACGGSSDDGSASSTTGGSTESGSTTGGGEPVVVEGITVEEDPSVREMLPEEIQESDTLTVANDSPFPPYELFEDEDQSKLTGFEPELARGLGGVLGIDFQLQQQPFDGIIPALQAGKFDLVMSAMTDTKERQGVLDFVDHSSTGLQIVVPKGNPKGINTLLELCGNSVAVQKATTDQAFLEGTKDECEEEGKSPISVQSYPNQESAFLAVESGKADAAFCDGAVGGYAAATIEEGDALEQVVDPKAPLGYQSNPIGIGMLKGQDELREAIAAALGVLMEDGVYEKLTDTWGMTNTRLKEVTINDGH